MSGLGFLPAGFAWRGAADSGDELAAGASAGGTTLRPAMSDGLGHCCFFSFTLRAIQVHRARTSSAAFPSFAYSVTPCPAANAS